MTLNAFLGAVIISGGLNNEGVQELEFLCSDVGDHAVAQQDHRVFALPVFHLIFGARAEGLQNHADSAHLSAIEPEHGGSGLGGPRDPQRRQELQTTCAPTWPSCPPNLEELIPAVSVSGVGRLRGTGACRWEGGSRLQQCNGSRLSRQA
eukprot:2597717-Rhodomonas_salina.6